VGYESTTQTKKKVNMKVKNTSQSPKVQDLFTLSNGKAVYGSFDGGHLTVVGGSPLLLMVEKMSHLVAGAAACVQEWRVPHLIKYKLWHLMWQRVLLICAGYASGINSNDLRKDAAIRLALGLDLGDRKGLASQPSMSRLENNLDSKDCYRITMFMILYYIARKGSCPKRIVLDFDGSCVPVHGDQQHTSYREYYDTKMYFPLFVYDQDGWLVCALLRPGKASESALTVPVLKRIVRVLRQKWPKVEIIIRVDSAFGSPELYDWCEDQGKEDPSKTIFYIVCFKSQKDGVGVAAGFKKMRAEASRKFGRVHGPQQYTYDGAPSLSEVEKEIKEAAKHERKRRLKTLRARVVRVFADGEYQTGKGGKDKKGWRQPRRIVASCVQTDWSRTCRYFVTNLPRTAEYQPQYLIEELYSQRGAMELRIKEYKALEGDRLSCWEFTANQARLIFHSLAYNTMYLLREKLPGVRQSWTFTTLQNRLIRMAAQITEKQNSYVLHWASAFEWKREFWTCVAKLRPKLP
jgi:hypothetical protein